MDHQHGLTKTLGYRQSIIDPCLFSLDSDDQRDDIEGIIALATDDLLHGGTDKHLSKMEELRQKYTLRKYTWITGRFVGKSFTPLEDGSLRIDQEFYTTARVQEIHLSRDRKRQRYSVCSPVEIEQLRALLGVLSWIAKETRADIAGKVALI